MQLTEGFLTPTEAAKKYRMTRSWIQQRIRRGDFAEHEIVRTRMGTMVTEAGLLRVLGEPDPNRVAPNAVPHRPHKRREPSK